MTRVTVAMATYNEAATIGAIMEGLNYQDWRVVVVDDDSPDGTAMLAGRHAQAWVTVRRSERGIATAYRLALQLALATSPDWVIQMDAGGTHRPVDAWYMAALAARTGADLVIGSRFRTRQGLQGARTLISLAAAALMRLRGVPATDATTGFRCWKPALLKKVIDKPFVSRGFAFQLETLYQAKRAGAQIDEISVPYLLTNSSFRPAMLKEALRIYLKLGELYG